MYILVSKLTCSHFIQHCTRRRAKERSLPRNHCRSTRALVIGLANWVAFSSFIRLRCWKLDSYWCTGRGVSFYPLTDHEKKKTIYATFSLLCARSLTQLVIISSRCAFPFSTHLYISPPNYHYTACSLIKCNTFSPFLIDTLCGQLLPFIDVRSSKTSVMRHSSADLGLI